MFVLSLLMGVVGVTTAFQHNWWEKRWSNSDSDTLGDGKAQFRHLENQWGDSNSIVGGPHFNQIDFRYPNWVVNPRPPCVQEGVFPHPKSTDCTWYYRCVARVGIPRYATFYFQCEPGTMFEDDLDQCVHPHSGYNCQGRPTPIPTPEPTPAPIDACTPLVSSCRNYQVCGGGVQHMCRQEICNPSGRVRDYCYQGQLKDMATGRCMEIPAPCPDPGTTCVAIDCKQVEVCNPSRSTKTICENERCTREGQDAGVRRMCGDDTSKVYDADNKRCISRPNENTCSCEYTKTNCREYDLCNPSGVRRLCDCDLCGSGMMYDPNAKVCVDKSILCPTLECVFRDSVCNCVNGMSLCTGCFMRGNLVHVSQFCKVHANAEFFHVEKDSCLYSDPGFFRASPGHCPRTRDSLLENLLTPSLTCSLRDNSIIRCY